MQYGSFVSMALLSCFMLLSRYYVPYWSHVAYLPVNYSLRILIVDDVDFLRNV
jgi:hypothetical protein